VVDMVLRAYDRRLLWGDRHNPRVVCTELPRPVPGSLRRQRTCIHARACVDVSMGSVSSCA